MGSYWLQEDFINNSEDIIRLAEKHKDKFSNRSPGNLDEFKNSRYGPSKLYTLFKHNMSDELLETIFKTIDKNHIKIKPDVVVINRYDPGCYLTRHKDHTGGYYKFNLIFLRTDKPHLKVYDEGNPEGVLIDEKPGALFKMPLSLEHEVTTIEEGEKSKFSLVLAWSL